MLDEQPQLANLQRLLTFRTFPGFARLSPLELTPLAEYAVDRYYVAGDRLFREGELVREVHFIVDGAVDMTRGGQPYGSFTNRDVIGGLAVLSRDPRGYDAVAVRDTHSMVIRAADMTDVYEDNFPMFLATTRGVCKAILDLRSRLGVGAGFREDFDDTVVCPSRPLDLVERLFFLRKTISFASTRIEVLAQLARDTVERRVPAGTVLWRVGDPSRSIAWPVAGVIRGETADGSQQFLLGPGGSAGGVDSVAAAPRWFTATTHTPVVLLELETERFFDVMEDHFDIAMSFLGVMSGVLMKLRETAAARGVVAVPVEAAR